MLSLVAAIAANFAAQLLKPFAKKFFTGEFDIKEIFNSGGMPSSHSAMVVSMTTMLAYQYGLDSPFFSISLVLSLIVCYDAANVRFYAGQNIKVVNKLIEDLQALTNLTFDDPIYLQKVKDVLGHKWIEVISGILLGLIVASVLYFVL